jgi:hypothetical protein
MGSALTLRVGPQNPPTSRRKKNTKRFAPDIQSKEMRELVRLAEPRGVDLRRDRDVAQVFENLDHIKTIVPSLPPGLARVQWIDTANSLFGAAGRLRPGATQPLLDRGSGEVEPAFVAAGRGH